MDKINYFDWAIFNSYVKLPEGTCKTIQNHQRLTCCL